MPNYSPTPTPYLSPSQGGNPYVPQGMVSYPISQNALPISSLVNGGTGWINNTYGYNQTPYQIPNQQVLSVDETNPQITGTPNPTPVPTPTPHGYYNANGDWVGVGNDTGGNGQQTQSIPTPNYDALINQINQNADVALAGLDPQRVAQEAIAQNMYTGGVSDLQAQQAQGNAALDITRRKAQENQVSTLNDLTENLRNMFNSGQTYLGSRGAGDSSAANQYSYALTQLGNKNRGNVMNQTASILNDINDRANQLQMQVTQGIKQLDTERGTQLQNIAQWFAQAQAQIRATKGQNIVVLGQQALDNAMNAINQVNANAQNQKNSLLQWAENNATTIQGLKSNMQQVFGNYNPQLPVAGNLPGITGGTVGSNGNYYTGNNPQRQETDIFGRPIQR